MITFFILALVAFLVELHLKELHLLVVDRLVLFELRLQLIVLLFKLLDQGLHLFDRFTLLVALSFFLLSKFRDFAVKLCFKLIIRFLQLCLGILRFL